MHIYKFLLTTATLLSIIFSCSANATISNLDLTNYFLNVINKNLFLEIYIRDHEEFTIYDESQIGVIAITSPDLSISASYMNQRANFALSWPSHNYLIVDYYYGDEIAEWENSMLDQYNLYMSTANLEHDDLCFADWLFSEIAFETYEIFIEQLANDINSKPGPECLDLQYMLCDSDNLFGVNVMNYSEGRAKLHYEYSTSERMLHVEYYLDNNIIKETFQYIDNEKLSYSHEGSIIGEINF